MTQVESIVTSSHLAIIEIFPDLLVRVETLYFREYRVCGTYVHKAHIIFHLIDPRRKSIYRFEDFQYENLYRIYRIDTNVFLSKC